MFEIPNLLEERKRKQFWVGLKKIIETQTIENETSQDQFILLTKCTTCSRVLQKIEDVAALCSLCDGELCEKHSTECFICGRIICRPHSTQVRGEFCCHDHWLFQKVQRALKK